MADRLVKNSRNVVLNTEMQHGDAIATCRILRGVSIETCRLVHLSAERTGSTLTDAAVDRVADFVLNGEMQHRNAVALQCGLHGVGIRAGNCQHIFTELIFAAVTEIHTDSIADVILDAERQDGDAVATL